jgi:hypothetical protein
MPILEIGQMSNKVNSWDEFQPLEAVVVGSIYDTSFFDGVKNTKVADVLKRIVDETAEDIEYFKNQLRSHNIQVYQASPTELGYHSSILDYVDVNGKMGYGSNHPEYVKDSLIPTSPLQVRDDSVVMGNKILVTDKTFEVDGYVKKFKEWFGEEQLDLSVYNGNYRFRQTEECLERYIKDRNLGETLADFTEEQRQQLIEENTLMGFCSPNLTRIGKKCLVDLNQTPTLIDFLKETYPQFSYEALNLGGHNDSIFSVLKPGLVISGPWFKGSEGAFKDWEIIYFNDTRWDDVREWLDLRSKNKGKWWVPGEEQNDQFTHFVESFLPDWTGFVEETIFDINSLVIDEKNVVINSNSPNLIKLLDSKGINPIVCPLRHRFFWDGGWHCLTLDVRRSGGQNDYGL